MTELTRDWERQVRVGARAIWGRGYNATLTAIIKAARMLDRGDDVVIYIQREPWSDKWCDYDNADLADAENIERIWGLLDNALTFGVWIDNTTSGWEYSYAAEAANTAAPLFMPVAA